MTISRSLRVVCPPGAGTPKTVADMIAAFRYTFTLPEVQRSPELRNFLSMMTTVAKRCAASVGKEPHRAKLKALVTNENKLIAHLEELGIEHHYAMVHLRCKNLMLELAHGLQWTCATYERQLECHRAWEPVRAALYGDTCGCASIADDAEKQLKDPSQVDESFFKAWRQPRPGRSFETTLEEEGKFRMKMRQAGLEYLFPLLDLSRQIPTEYAIKPEKEPTLIEDIEVAVLYKTANVVKGRPAKERVKPRTGKQIRTALKEYCGVAINLLHIEGIDRLRDVFTEPTFIEVIKHLREKRLLPEAGIRGRFSCFSFLPKTGLLPEGDYSWFRRELNKLRDEPRWRLDERQRARSISYEELAEIPRKIRACRLKGRKLSPEQIGRLLHDELFTKWSLFLPWRFCSIADCGLFAPAHINIIDWELTDAMRLDPDLPAGVRKALKHNPHQRFLQFSFGKSQCKNGHEVRDIVPLELAKLYREYKKYRQYIVDQKHDDGTLFVNSNGRRLSAQACRGLYQRLVRRWLDCHARPHLTRDAFCEYRLAHGDSMRQLKRKLWHRSYISTERYCRRFDTSHGAVAVERKFERQRNRIAA
jgi:hypothetical protein